jgi:hypothetical protein
MERRWHDFATASLSIRNTVFRLQIQGLQVGPELWTEIFPLER